MDFEFIALDKTGEKGEWLWNFIEDIPFWPKLMDPICIHCDSQAAIGRAKIICITRILITYDKDIILIDNYYLVALSQLVYVKSNDNVSDPLTKGFSRDRVERSPTGLGLWMITSHCNDRST